MKQLHATRRMVAYAGAIVLPAALMFSPLAMAHAQTMSDLTSYQKNMLAQEGKRLVADQEAVDSAHNVLSTAKDALATADAQLQQRLDQGYMDEHAIDYTDPDATAPYLVDRTYYDRIDAAQAVVSQAQNDLANAESMLHYDANVYRSYLYNWGVAEPDQVPYVTTPA